MTESEVTTLQKLSGELRTTFETMAAQQKGIKETISEHVEKLNKIHERLDKTETVVSAKADRAEADEKLEKRFQALEAMLERKGGKAGDTSADSAKEKAIFAKNAYFKHLRFETFQRVGRSEGSKFQLTEEETKVLRVSDDTAGGYLAPLEFVREILMNVVQYSNIRALARIRTTGNKGILIPKRTATPTAVWVAETQLRPDTGQPAFGMEEVNVYEMHGNSKISWQELEDAQFDMETFLREELAEQFGVTEAQAFINGNGVGKPEGMLVSSQVTSINGANAAALTGDDYIRAYYDVAEPYLPNARWLMNRATLRETRLLKDGIGNYVWAPGIQTDARPATILDAPYITAPEMPAPTGSGVFTTGTFPVLFGDISRAYLIVDRLAMQYLSDPYILKQYGAVEISARRRVGGQVVLGEALRKIRVS